MGADHSQALPKAIKDNRIRGCINFPVAWLGSVIKKERKDRPKVGGGSGVLYLYKLDSFSYNNSE
jgi:hypothetical protein